MTLTESIQKYYAAKKEAERHFSAKVAYWQTKVNAGKAKQESVSFVNRDIEKINAVTHAVALVLKISQESSGGGLSNSDWQLIALVQAKFQHMDKDLEAAYLKGYRDGVGEESPKETLPVFSSKEDKRNWTIANARNRDGF